MLRSMTLSFKVETVTPRMAKAWLAKNIETNRAPKKGRIPMYARDMKLGRWELTGEAIKFNESGQLIDGQNRLRAVILADVPVDFAVMRGVPDSAFDVIDSGAVRTTADSLTLSISVVSIVRWSLMWDIGVYNGSSGSFKPTNIEIRERYQDDMKLFDSAASRGRDCSPRGLGTARIAGMAHYLFSRVDVEATHAFFDQYISGANLPGKSAVLVLRNRMGMLRAERLNAGEQLALFIRAWNNVRADIPTERLIISHGPLANHNFPMPK